MLYYYLGKKYRPSCKPKDYHLKKYRNGKQGYFEEAQKQVKARQNRAELVQINSYAYGSSYSGNSLYINAKIKNLNSNGKVVLSKAELSCSIIANKAYRIFKGRVYMFPKLISGGQGEISMYFLPGDFTNRYFQKNSTYQHTEDDRYISLSNVRNQVKSLAINCDVVNAWFGI